MPNSRSSARPPHHLPRPLAPTDHPTSHLPAKQIRTVCTMLDRKGRGGGLALALVRVRGCTVDKSDALKLVATKHTAVGESPRRLPSLSRPPNVASYLE